MGVAGDHPLLHVERLHAAGPKPDSTSKSGAFRPVKQFSALRLAGRHSPSRRMPMGARGAERVMKSKFLALTIAIAALNVFAPAVGHAQGFQVNGHAASKAEAQLLVSYGVQKGNWVVDGFGIASADSGQIRPATATTSGGQKCWYVLDVQLCD